MRKQQTGHLADADVAWQDMGGGVSRKILVYEPQMLMMRNRFNAGSEGPLHSHPHVQSTYVISGVFDITIGERTKRMRAGDSFLVPSSVEHGARCVEAGEVIEVFTPVREDFLA